MLQRLLRWLNSAGSVGTSATNETSGSLQGLALRFTFPSLSFYLCKFRRSKFLVYSLVGLCQCYQWLLFSCSKCVLQDVKEWVSKRTAYSTNSAAGCRSSWLTTEIENISKLPSPWICNPKKKLAFVRRSLQHPNPVTMPPPDKSFYCTLIVLLKSTLTIYLFSKPCKSQIVHHSYSFCRSNINSCA